MNFTKFMLFTGILGMLWCWDLPGPMNEGGPSHPSGPGVAVPSEGRSGDENNTGLTSGPVDGHAALCSYPWNFIKEIYGLCAFKEVNI